MKKHILLIVGIIIVVSVGVYMYLQNGAEPAEDAPLESTSVRATNVEDYVKAHITELSPEKATMGGTFMVTNIEAHDGEGTVYYEDGHNAYVADFFYTMDEQKGITFTSFVIRNS